MRVSEIDIKKASEILSGLKLHIVDGNIIIDIVWVRAMPLNGEWDIRKHMHSTIEFHYIAEGACKIILDNGEFTAKKGDVYIVAPFIYHSQHSINSEYFLEYSLNCDFRIIKHGSTSNTENIISLLANVPCYPIADVDNTFSLFDMIFKEACDRKFDYEKNIKQLISMILLSAFRLYYPNQSPIKARKRIRRNMDVRFQTLKRFIEDNIAVPININDISQHMYLSERQIYRIIKANTGKSTKEYILDIKEKMAKDMILNTTLSINEISRSLGFTSEYYFTSFFKRRTGTAPTHYRKNIETDD